MARVRILLLIFCLILSSCSVKIPLKTSMASVEWEYFFVDKVTSKSKSEYSNDDNAVMDGDIVTEWQSSEEDNNSWVAVRLQSARIIRAVKISWGAVAAEVYDVQVSENGKTWQTVAEIDDGMSDEVRTIELEPVSTKNIRILCAKKTGETGGYTVKEIELNPSDGTSSGGIQFTASSTMAGNLPEMAFDGDQTTRWESEHGIDDSWIAVDFGTPRKVRKVKVKWERAGAAKYSIDVSDDGTDWKTVGRVSDGKEQDTRTIRFSPVTTRYVRVNMTKRVTEWGYSIWEIEVFK